MTNRWHWDNAEQMIVSVTDNSHLAIEDFIMFTNGVEREREQLRASNAKLSALMTPELAELLERLAKYANLYNAAPLAYDARALAAQIREALDDGRA